MRVLILFFLAVPNIVSFGQIRLGFPHHTAFHCSLTIHNFYLTGVAALGGARSYGTGCRVRGAYLRCRCSLLLPRPFKQSTCALQLPQSGAVGIGQYGVISLGSTRFIVRDRHHASGIPAGMALMSRCCALWDEPKTKQNRLRDLTMLGKPNQIETCRTDATNGGSQRNALPDEISKQRRKK